jgi:hypothetical protein
MKVMDTEGKNLREFVKLGEWKESLCEKLEYL